MPTTISEESLELEIGLLEAVEPDSSSYPYPRLVPSGASQKRTFRAAVLENAYLRATFVPALGGRLLSLFDKRTGVELLSSSPDSSSSSLGPQHPEPLRPIAAGRRGAELRAGIELHLDGERRLTSLGAVQFGADESEDGPAGLWLSEAVTGTGLSWHLRVSMPDDRAEIRIEARIFNRTLGELPYNAGLLTPALGDNRFDSGVFCSFDGSRGIALFPEAGSWDGAIVDGGLWISRFSEPKLIAPRQLDTWAVSIVPFSGLGGLSAVSRDAALCVGEDRVQIQGIASLVRHKLVLLTRSGKTLEAAVEIQPAQILAMGLPEPVAGVALMDSTREALRWEGDWRPVKEMADHRQRAPSRIPKHLDDDSATFDISTRHIANAMLGQVALANGDLLEADRRFEQSLLYNGEDHLTWWMKAIATRMREAERDESPELLNAHYLAPLEPALRAESFLARPQTVEKGPSAVLKPMDEFPESFIEVAALLVEARLYQEASRWIDEALRHVDLPMLRYQLAYSHLQASGLDLDAADQVAAAAKSPVGPPYPWRVIEIDALRALAERFPGDARLREWLDLARLCEPQ